MGLQIEMYVGLMARKSFVNIKLSKNPTIYYRYQVIRHRGLQKTLFESLKSKFEDRLITFYQSIFNFFSLPESGENF